MKKPVESIPQGEFVRRSETAKKTYIRSTYDRSSKRYALTDTEDTSHEIWVKRGTLLLTGFTY